MAKRKRRRNPVQKLSKLWKVYVDLPNVTVLGGVAMSLDRARREAARIKREGVYRGRKVFGTSIAPQTYLPGEFRRIEGTRYKPMTNPTKSRKRVPPVWNAEVDTWFERDRASVVISNKLTGKTIAEWWDDDVRELIEDGLLDSRDLENSALDYAVSLGLLREE